MGGADTSGACLWNIGAEVEIGAERQQRRNLTLVGLLTALLLTSCGGESAGDSKSEESSRAHRVLLSKDDLPGSGWIVVGEDDFTQFDIPKDLSAAPDVCKQLVPDMEKLRALQAEPADRAVRLIRSSSDAESVQVTAYVMEFADSTMRTKFFDAANAMDLHETADQCFGSAFASGPDGRGVQVSAVEPYGAVPDGGMSLGRHVQFSINGKPYETQVQIYRWPDQQVVVEVQLIGPPSTRTPDLVESVLAAVSQKLASS